ncbi:Serine/threonine-protein kinase pkn1 [Chlamydiales bacterium STE3]|nr:Serine/threonine-protein kinase pkn1 [Chlamydiales bacterium STE3]
METRFLGDYQVIKQIGQGSLGSVFLAEHRFMKRQYVIKLLPEEITSDRNFIQRFEEEVAVLSTLDHANIVKIHNISFSQGHYFLVTDCVVDDFAETTNLAQFLAAEGRKIDEDLIFKILFQVADALDYAHRKKVAQKAILHRGLKLNNILIGAGKENPQLYLSDFGLTKIVGAGAVLTRTLKTVGESVGLSGIIFQKTGLDRYPNPPQDIQKLTPLQISFIQNYAFMAPEQKRFDLASTIDITTDTYAFGVLAYYLLTGEFPEGIFALPSELVHNLKWDWDGLIKSCLNANPKKRAEFLMPLLSSIKSEKANIPVVEAILKESIHEERLRPIIHVPKIERPVPDLDPAAALIVDTTVKQYVPELQEDKNIQPMMTEMSVIMGGAFFRGSTVGNRDEMPRHQITLSSFAIDIHPVSNEQFVRFLEAMGGEKDNNHHDIIRMRDSRIKRTGGKLSIESGYAKHPVVGVTWYGAIAYAKWVGKRLPTEAEWEIASRGGNENALFPTGNEIEKSQGNFFSSDTTAVMSYAPNDYGLYDMAGNVYEWCQDWYGYNYYEISLQEPENPKGPHQGVYRVLKGGCWKSLKEDLRCSKRHRNNPGTVNGTYGFRCAADVA